MGFINEWMTDLTAGAVLGIGAYLFNTVQRVTVMEALGSKRDEEVKTLRDRSEAHDRLLTGLDALLSNFKDMLPDVKNMGRLVDKLDIILETTNKRLEILENEMLGVRARHTP